MYVSEHLNLRSFGKGRRDKSCSPTGPWEIRPTGMTTEACGTVCATGAGLRPAGKPGEMPPDPTVSCAPHSIQTDGRNANVQFCEGGPLLFNGAAGRYLQDSSSA